MKKALSLLVSLVMLISVCSMGITGAYEITNKTEYPVIVVPGFMSSELYKIDEETGEVTKVTVTGYLSHLLGKL